LRGPETHVLDEEASASLAVSALDSTLVRVQLLDAITEAVNGVSPASDVWTAAEQAAPGGLAHAVHSWSREAAEVRSALALIGIRCGVGRAGLVDRGSRRVLLEALLRRVESEGSLPTCVSEAIGAADTGGQTAVEPGARVVDSRSGHGTDTPHHVHVGVMGLAGRMRWTHGGRDAYAAPSVMRSTL